MGKWGKWVLLFVVAMVFAVPAWAVDLKLGGKYEIQGRYYSEKDIYSAETGRDTTTINTMYLKHYFNLYPTLTVTDKIAIKGDIEVFDNIISVYDSYQYWDKSSSVSTQAGETGQADYFDQYSTFTVNELYVDATTDYGKFIVGKLKQFNGIGWFIQVPQVPDWTFGLIYNKKNEGYDKQSNEGYDTATQSDGSDAPGVVTNHAMADETHYILIANYAKDAIDFKGTLAYKYTGADAAKTRIWYPFFYFNYALTKDWTFNSKVGFANGPLVQKDSRVAKASVAAFGTALDEGVWDDLNENILDAIGDMPTDQTSATYAADLATWQAMYSGAWNTASAALGGATPNQAYAGMSAAIDAATADQGFAKDWEVDSIFGGWIGMGYKLNDLKIQGDFAYLPGADAPNLVSGYLEDTENLDTWLMNDISDIYGARLQTPATIAALGLPTWDGNYSFANVMMARLNLAYQFTKKLDGNLNFVWAKMENTDYLENWDTSSADMIGINGLDPDAMKAGGPGIVVGGQTLVDAPAQAFDVDADMGWEVRGRLNYALQDNLTVGLDLCYYQPGDLYKGLIENGWVDGANTGYKLENTYAGRWKMTVKF